jgi:hypothetical protein
MLRADDIARARPMLTASGTIAAVVRELAPAVESRADLWRVLVDSFAVDLDQLAAILPVDEPDPVWLARRA